MHEVGLCQALLEAIERRAQGRRVVGVRVRIGALHRVDPPSFEQAFALVSAGTVASNAQVDLVVVPARYRCQACGRVTDSADLLALCPTCGATVLVLEGGDELLLESIRYADDSERPEPLGKG